MKARRALRALRGLVKLQALVRGNIVRKQAAQTLRCMEALVRVQARARACRALRSQRSSSDKCPPPRAVSLLAYLFVYFHSHQETETSFPVDHSITFLVLGTSDS